VSTKASLAFSHEKDTDFHLYREMMEDDAVYLTLGYAGLEYEAGNGSVTVRIPLEIWEVIRAHKPVELPFAGWSDEQIDAYVETEVDERIAEYRAELEKTGREKSITAMLGALCFGMAYDPREEQVEHGRSWYRRVRDEETEIARRMAAIRKENEGWNGLAVIQLKGVEEKLVSTGDGP
jgi:hypothetical protein